MDTASTTVEGLGTSMDEKFQSLIHKIKLHQSGEYLTVEALEQVKFKSFSLSLVSEKLRVRVANRNEGVKLFERPGSRLRNFR